MKHSSLISVPLLLLVLCLAAPSVAAAGEAPLRAAGASAAVGTAFTYQGRLVDGGAPANGNYDFAFKLYDALTEGSQLGGTVTQTIAVTGGYFTTQLDFGPVFNGEARWLEIGVRLAGSGNLYTVLEPRQPLTPAPYALALPFFRTRQDDPWSPTIIGGHGANASLGASPGATISGGGTSDQPNQVTSNFGTVSGGLGNSAAIASVVGGGADNTAAGGWSAIGGGARNAIATNAVNSTIAGGSGNQIQAMGGAIGGGGQTSPDLATGNIISDEYGTIGGGSANRAGDPSDGNTKYQPYATVGGGWGNQALAGYATIGGGGLLNFNEPATGNRVYDEHGTVGGGGNNVAGANDGDSGLQGYATVGGGHSNQALAFGATVAGGYKNVASSPYAAIGGGSENSASGDDSTVGGGEMNTAGPFQWATVGGGNLNQAYGTGATVPGGIGAQANEYGQMAYASGAFDEYSLGTAQTSTYVLRNTTRDATPTELFLDGVSQRIVVTNRETWVFDALVVARSDTAQSAGYRVQGVAETQNGVMTFIGTPAVTTLGEEVAAWNVAVQADSATYGLKFVVTGQPASTIRWVATVRTVEVNYWVN